MNRFRLSLFLAVLAVSSAGWSQQQNNPPAPASPPPADPNAPPPKSYSGGMTCGNHKCSSTNQPDAPDSSPAFKPGDTQQHPPASKTADDNPFPEAESKAAQDDAHKAEQGNATPAENGSPENSSPDSSSPESSSQDRLKGTDILGNNKPRSSDGAGAPVYSPELATKDDKVGIFYLQSGDFKGAYDRYKEATQVNPGDAEAVFGLAEAARKLGKHEEAVQNYQTYLDALPNGPHSKEARKALKQLDAH